MSVRASTGCARTCSGDMYPTVPSTMPAPVPAVTVACWPSGALSSGRVSFARPKSRIFTRPSVVTNRFSGFRSRCTMPLSCAAARPCATCIAYVNGLAHRQAARTQLIAERLALQQLRDDVGRAVLVPDVIDGQDVRMVQRRGRLRLLREPAEAIRIGSEARRQHLDGDLAPEHGVAGPVHLAHAAGAERRENLASTKSVASSEAHRCWRVYLQPITSPYVVGPAACDLR